MITCGRKSQVTGIHMGEVGTRLPGGGQRQETLREGEGERERGGEREREPGREAELGRKEREGTKGGKPGRRREGRDGGDPDGGRLRYLGGGGGGGRKGSGDGGQRRRGVPVRPSDPRSQQRAA